MARSRNTLQDPALKPPQKRCKLSGSQCTALGVAMNQNAIQEAGFDWSCRFGMRNRLLNIKGVMHGGLAGAAAHFCRCRPFGVMVRSRAGNDATSVEIGYLDPVLDVPTTKGALR